MLFISYIIGGLVCMQSYDLFPSRLAGDNIGDIDCGHDWSRIAYNPLGFKPYVGG